MIRRNRTRRSARPSYEVLDERIVLSAVTGAQLRTAYGISSFNYIQNGKTVTPDGTGETVALVDAYHDPNLFSNVQTFDAHYGLSNPSITQYYYTSASNDGWATEEVLDVEAVHAFAPGAKIVVVEAASTSSTDLFTAENYARNLPGVVAVSMSFGSSEFSGEKNFDQDFTTPAGHTGEAFFASTGDNGAAPGAEYPSTSPNVIAVGGTTLNVSSSGGYISETGWSGSGGGVSKYEAKPSYQYGYQSSSYKTVPDVSLDADPNTGLVIYETAPSNGKGGYQQYGGTSLASPLFAAYTAIVDQGRAIEGRNTLDGPTQLLPAIYASSTANGFHDITSGNNGYSAHAGYDLVTGMGTINGYPLTVDLLNLANKTTFGSNAVSVGGGGSTGVVKTSDVSVDLAQDVAKVDPAPTTQAKAETPALILGTIAEPDASLIAATTGTSPHHAAHDAALDSLYQDA